MYWVILGIFLIIWLIGKISDSYGSKKTFQVQNQRSKYDGRILDENLSLFERNIDIIAAFEKKIISNPSYRSYYYLENETRDCINEICHAENRLDIRPDYDYLSTWKGRAPAEWVELSRQIQQVFRERQTNLTMIESEVAKTRNDLNIRQKSYTHPQEVLQIKQYKASRPVELYDIMKFLSPNKTPWCNKEGNLIGLSDIEKPFPLFKFKIENGLVNSLNNEIHSFNRILEKDLKAHQDNQLYFNTMLYEYKSKQRNAVINRLNHIINDISFPASFTKNWQIDYDRSQGIAIVELQLPDVVHQAVVKKIELKKGTVTKPLTQKEVKEEVPKIHPSIILRIAYEIFRNEVGNVIKLLVVNGWVEYPNPSNGQLTKTYTASIAVEKEQIINLNLSKLDPLVAFANLKGKSAGKLVDIIPITPVMSLNKKDKRFIETKQVLSELGNETNLASMDWQDFESLIAELFTKEFEKEGGEVKVTQASRDRGVDAIAFDPDPIKGGKFVIQAKRYTNTVDVSAVRDLCAVVKKEGASRGILVTTSTYGSDAYAFANNEPVTLLDGAELLGLLNKHGYSFRINLQEARKINKENVL